MDVAKPWRSRVFSRLERPLPAPVCFSSTAPLVAMFIHDTHGETCKVTTCQELAASSDALSMIPSDREEKLAAVHTCVCVCVEGEERKRTDLGLIHRHYGEQDVICKLRLTHMQTGTEKRELNKCVSLL